MSEPVIRCRDLRKTYAGKPPVEALRGIDLTVEEGECFGVLGPNGAGKTTAIEILEGLLPATSGDVQILGRRWHEEADGIRQRIGISLQETQLSEKLNKLKIKFVVEPYIRFKDKNGEQATMFIKDPSGNVLEFKSFKNFESIFSK